MQEQRRVVVWTSLLEEEWARGRPPWVCALSPSFLSFWHLLTLPWPSVGFFVPGGRNRSEVPALGVWADPRCAGSFGHIMWGGFFVFRMTSGSDYWCVCGTALYLCFSRTVPVSFVFPCFCFIFKLCRVLFVWGVVCYFSECVRDIKAFINLMLVWLISLKGHIPGDTEWPVVLSGNHLLLASDWTSCSKPMFLILPSEESKALQRLLGNSM